MVRSLTSRNGLPWRPTRCWVNSTGGPWNTRQARAATARARSTGPSRISATARSRQRLTGGYQLRDGIIEGLSPYVLVGEQSAGAAAWREHQHRTGHRQGALNGLHHAGRADHGLEPGPAQGGLDVGGHGPHRADQRGLRVGANRPGEQVELPGPVALAVTAADQDERAVQDVDQGYGRG